MTLLLKEAVSLLLTGEVWLTFLLPTLSVAYTHTHACAHPPRAHYYLWATSQPGERACLMQMLGWGSSGVELGWVGLFSMKYFPKQEIVVEEKQRKYTPRIYGNSVTSGQLDVVGKRKLERVCQVRIRGLAAIFAQVMQRKTGISGYGQLPSQQVHLNYRQGLMGIVRFSKLELKSVSPEERLVELLVPTGTAN